ncbi:MAG: hypothetical protein LH617_08975 [Ramlibacter sp.]|nr:hypothetical protein [Ramlibacter sp.]
MITGSSTTIELEILATDIWLAESSETLTFTLSPATGRSPYNTSALTQPEPLPDVPDVPDARSSNWIGALNSSGRPTIVAPLTGPRDRADEAPAQQSKMAAEMV